MLTKPSSRSAGWFNRFAVRSAHVVGSPRQLVVNSLTNIATYLVVFVIQNSQNRDSEAINLKLNELISATRNASDELINVEDLSDSQIEGLFQKYERTRDE